MMSITGKDSRLSKELEAGQIWKVEERFVQITEVGKRLIHYKMLKTPEQRVAATKLASREEVLHYLRRTKAGLVCPTPEVNLNAQSSVGT